MFFYAQHFMQLIYKIHKKLHLLWGIYGKLLMNLFEFDI